jgi:hypothetical protein
MNRAAQVFLAGLLLAAPCLAATKGDRPPIGSYGFDSLKPETTRCAKLDAAAISKLQDCSLSKQNSFGDDREGWACRIGKRSGFMAYRTQDDCKAELELEKANGD